MWRYREHFTDEFPKAAYVWHSDESVGSYSSDKLCLYVQNGFSEGYSHLEVVEFNYDFDHIDLQSDLFVNSVVNCVTKTHDFATGGEDAIREVFQHIKRVDFPKRGGFQDFVTQICNSDRIIYNNVSFDHLFNTNLFVQISPEMQPAIDVVLQDKYADMNIFSHAKTRFDKLFKDIAKEVYGDYFGTWTYEHCEDNLQRELERKFFPLTPLNIARFKRDLILMLYPIKVEHAEVVDVKYMDVFKEEAGEYDWTVFKKLLAAKDKQKQLEGSIKDAIGLVDLASAAGCSDVEVGTF